MLISLQAVATHLDVTVDKFVSCSNVQVSPLQYYNWTTVWIYW